MVKNPPAMQDTWVQSLGREDLLEKGMGAHSGILSWRIPMDRGAWWATVHTITKSRTQPKRISRHVGSRADGVAWGGLCIQSSLTRLPLSD